jgi:hypothetical protein
VSGSANNEGGHSHTITGTATNEGGHTHTVTGTATDEGGHTHTVTGTVDEVGSHNHDATNRMYAWDGPGTEVGFRYSIDTGSGGINYHAARQAPASATDITIGYAGAHGHTFSNGSASGGGHTHSVAGTGSGGGHIHSLSGTGSGGGHIHSLTVTMDSDGAHTHTLTGLTDSFGGDAGSDLSISIVPSYYTLVYIMKVK